MGACLLTDRMVAVVFADLVCPALSALRVAGMGSLAPLRGGRNGGGRGRAEMIQAAWRQKAGQLDSFLLPPLVRV